MKGPRFRRLGWGAVWAALLAFFAPGHADAQDLQHALAFMAGGLSQDRDGRALPTAAVRFSERLWGPLLVEVGVSHARATAAFASSVPGAVGGPGAERARRSVTTMTAGVQAEWALARARPYAGVSLGVAGRFDPERGERLLGTVVAFPLGVRVPLAATLDGRAELRLRRDQRGDGDSVSESELLIGLSVRF